MNNTTTQKVGWVPEPNGRGTLGLVWSCLATIFLCTWSAIHPDVPPIDEKPMRTLAHRLGRVALAMFAPELMAILAIGELMEARKIQASITGWSLKQAFFLQMGGYQLSHPEEKPFAPTSTDFVEPWSGDMISDPGLKEINIDDRIKADGLVKVITVVQVLWFTMQIVGRVSLRLPLTTIELFTLGIVASGAIMYGCWWNKPFDVRTPIILQVTSLTPHRSRSFNNYNSYCDYWWERETVDLTHKDVSFFFSVVTLVFGGIHVLGWNFDFASVAEMWLWRVSSIGCTVLPLLLPIMSLGGLDKMIETVSKAFLVIISILYGTMRLYMFVEMFVALRAAPVGIYQTPQWSQYLPSLG